MHTTIQVEFLSRCRKSNNSDLKWQCQYRHDP